MIKYMVCGICGKPSARHKIWGNGIVYDYCNDHWVNDERQKQIEIKKMEEMRKKLMEANRAVVDKPYYYKIDNSEIKKEVKNDRIIVRDDKLQWRIQLAYLKSLNDRIAKVKSDN